MHLDLQMSSKVRFRGGHLIYASPPYFWDPSALPPTPCSSTLVSHRLVVRPMPGAVVAV